VKLSVRPEVLALFPDAIVGLAAATNVRNTGEDPQDAADLRRAEAGLAARVGNVPVAEHPRIAAWRDAYRRFGAKPKDNPSSIENLVRRVLKGWTVPHVNRLVDIYNAISLEMLLPAGGEDMDAIEGDVELTVAAEDEPPVRLLGEPEARPPKPGEVIYRDRAGAICRRWNWKEADRTKLTEATRSAILVVEGLPPATREDVSAAVEELARRVRERCGATVVTGILEGVSPDFLIFPSAQPEKSTNQD
jgi:DNA/RNA-binding domain of Phe-tRNA-synthetase-like protein